MEHPHLHPSWYKVRDITKEEFNEKFPKVFRRESDGTLVRTDANVPEQTEKELFLYMIKHNMLFLKQ